MVVTFLSFLFVAFYDFFVGFFNFFFACNVFCMNFLNIFLFQVAKNRYFSFSSCCCCFYSFAFVAGDFSIFFMHFLINCFQFLIFRFFRFFLFIFLFCFLFIEIGFKIFIFCKRKNGNSVFVKTQHVIL